MHIIETSIPDLIIIEPDLFKDDRGYFFESFSQKKFNELTGLDTIFVQDNESKSSFGVIRGLHYQYGEHAQAKLVRVVKGGVIDFAIDLRKGSPTFGKYEAVRLTEDNHRQFYIPRGFAHGFISLTNDTIFQYKCDNYYCPEAERGIIWNDPDINIDWVVDYKYLNISPKDMVHPTLKEATDLFEYKK